MGFLNRLYSFLKAIDLEKPDPKRPPRIFECEQRQATFDFIIEIREYTLEMCWGLFPPLPTIKKLAYPFLLP